MKADRQRLAIRSADPHGHHRVRSDPAAARVVLVTGASSGIGRATAARLADAGHVVFAAARRASALDALAAEHPNTRPVVLDVTEQTSIDSAVEQVQAATDGLGLDVLVNAAGTMLLGPVAALPEEQVRAQFDVNLFGLLAVTRAFVPQMRQRGAGRIVNISSILGRFALPGTGPYSASKFAVEACSDALRMGSSGGERLAGITPAELAAIRGRLEAFADDVFESLPRKDQRARGQCYLRGLMLDGRRKSIEPMAARLGEVHYQALQYFVAVSPWDWRPVRRRLAERLVEALEPTAWAADDTAFPKDGDHSVGVQRQYCGTLGKTANCQLGVSVNAVTEQASCPLSWRLFLPEGWDDDAERRAALPPA